MKFQETVTLVNGATHPDPIALPENVPPRLIKKFPYRAPDDERPNKRLVVGLDAPTAETTTFTVYALNYEDDNELIPAVNKRWYEVGSFTSLAGGVLDELTEHIAGGGTFYIRQTADTLTTPRELNLKMTA